MKSPHFEEVGEMTPLGAALVQLTTCHGCQFTETADRLQEAFERDYIVPESGLFSPRMVRDFYRERGEEVNVVPLRRFQGTCGLNSRRRGKG